MSKYFHREWKSIIIMLVVAFALLFTKLGLDSERTKRVELEAEVSEYRADIWGRFHKSIWIEGNRLSFKNPTGDSIFKFYIFDCPVDTVFIGLGDNKIQFSPIDSSEVTELIQDRPLLKKMLEGNYIDSVGIGESRTWMRPRGTDSVIEVTE